MSDIRVLLSEVGDLEKLRQDFTSHISDVAAPLRQAIAKTYRTRCEHSGAKWLFSVVPTNDDKLIIRWCCSYRDDCDANDYHLWIPVSSLEEEFNNE